MLRDNISALFYRARRFSDIAGLYRLLQFRELRREFYRELWSESAKQIGAECQSWNSDYFRVVQDGMTTMVRLSSVMMDDHLRLDIMGNKLLTYLLLHETGCPTPPFCTYSMRSLSSAEDFIRKYTGPFVVKPASGTGGGAGVTTGIDGAADLRRASRLASRFCPSLLIEPQLEGGSYRLLYLDGKYIDAIRRDPPILVGDGRSTIRQLIKLENEKRLHQKPVTALSPLTIDRDCINILRSQGLSLRSVLAKGHKIKPKRTTNENGAQQNHNVKEDVHPNTIMLGSHLATSLGVRFAGIDVICKDILAPLTPENGRIVEINTTPGIHHHYLIAETDRIVPVADLILSHIFNTRQGVMRLCGALPLQMTEQTSQRGEKLANIAGALT